MKLYEAEEDGRNPLDNATVKAKIYYSQLKRPVFSCDSGLFFDNVDEKDQPGNFIRRVNGRSLTDSEMLLYYSGLARKYEGKLTAYYKNAICLILNEDRFYTYDGKDLNSEKFYIVEKPHYKTCRGFPLDSLSVEMKSMKYYYDLDVGQSKNLGVIAGFRKFFARTLSE